MALLQRQFHSPLVLAGLVAGVLREWIDASVILMMVPSSTLIGFSQEQRASRAVAELRQRLALTARVRQGGAVVSRPFAELVPATEVAAVDLPEELVVSPQTSGSHKGGPISRAPI